MKISKNTFWLKNKTFIVNCNTFYTESWECPSQIIEHFILILETYNWGTKNKCSV